MRHLLVKCLATNPRVNEQMLVVSKILNENLTAIKITVLKIPKKDQTDVKVGTHHVHTIAELKL